MGFSWRLEIPLNLLWCTKVLYSLFIQLLKAFLQLIIVPEKVSSIITANSLWPPRRTMSLINTIMK